MRIDRGRVAFNFKRLRKQKGWSVAEAILKHQEVTGKTIDESYIYQIEKGFAGFGKNASKKWAHIFNVDISEFYKNPEEVLPPDEAEFLELYRQAKEYGIEDLALQNLRVQIFYAKDRKEHGKSKGHIASVPAQRKTKIKTSSLR